MIDVINLTSEEFQICMNHEGGAIVLRGRQSIVFGILILKYQDKEHAIRVEEIRHVNFHQLSSYDIKRTVVRYRYSFDTLITYICWRKI